MGIAAEGSALGAFRDKAKGGSCPDNMVEKCPSGFCKCYCMEGFVEMPHPAYPKKPICVDPQSDVYIAYTNALKAKSKKEDAEEDDDTKLTGKFSGKIEKSDDEQQITIVGVKETKDDNKNGDVNLQGEQSTVKLNDGQEYDNRAFEVVNGIKVDGDINITINISNDYGGQVTGDLCKQEPASLKRQMLEPQDMTRGDAKKTMQAALRAGSFRLQATLEDIVAADKSSKGDASAFFRKMYEQAMKRNSNKKKEKDDAQYKATQDRFQVVYGPYEKLRLRSSFGTLITALNHHRLLNNVFLSFGAEILRTQIQSVKSFQHIKQIPIIDPELVPKGIDRINNNVRSRIQREQKDKYDEYYKKLREEAQYRFDTNVYRPINAFGKRFDIPTTAEAYKKEWMGLTEMDQKEEQTWAMADPYGEYTDTVLQALADTFSPDEPTEPLTYTGTARPLYIAVDSAESDDY